MRLIFANRILIKSVCVFTNFDQNFDQIFDLILGQNCTARKLTRFTKVRALLKRFINNKFIFRNRFSLLVFLKFLIEDRSTRSALSMRTGLLESLEGERLVEALKLSNVEQLTVLGKNFSRPSHIHLSDAERTKCK